MKRILFLLLLTIPLLLQAQTDVTGSYRWDKISYGFRYVRLWGDSILKGPYFTDHITNGTTAGRKIDYSANYGSTFTSRSLIDKGYVDSITTLLVRYTDTAAMLFPYLRKITASGDVTGVSTGSGSSASISLTLATVNSSPGMFGAASKSLTATVDAKGRITSLTEQSIQITIAQVTSLQAALDAKVPTTTTVAGFELSSNVTLAALTAGDASLTFSGSYDGSTARNIILNLGNANVFTATQSAPKFNITATSTSGSAGSLYWSTSNGLSIYARAGSANDLSLFNGSGSAILVVPTGTQTVQFQGAVSIGTTFNLAPASVSDATGDVLTMNTSTGRVNRRTYAEILSDIGALSTSTAASTYLPLTAGSGTPLTGHLYTNSNILFSTNTASLIWTASGNKTEITGQNGTLIFWTGTSGYTTALTLDASQNAALVGNLTVSGTGTNSFAGLISSTNPQVFQGTQTTSYLYSQLTNTSGNMRLGVVGSSSGLLFTGSAAYETVIGNTVAQPFAIFTNDTRALTISSGQVATFTNSVNGTNFTVKGAESNTAGLGPYYQWANTGGTRYWLAQLNTSENLDFHYFNGTLWGVKQTFNNDGSAWFTGGLTLGTSVVANTGQLTMPRNTTISWNANSATQDQYIYADNSSNLKFATVNTIALTINSGQAVNLSSLGTGTVYSNAGTLTNTNPSDRRLKNSIADVNYGLTEIMKLRPVSFYYNSDSAKQNLTYGFIAQDVLPVMPDAVREIGNGSDMLGLHPEVIYAALVKAIQEQQREIEALKNQIETINNKIKT